MADSSDSNSGGDGNGGSGNELLPVTYLPDGHDFERVGEVRDGCGGTAKLFIETVGGAPLRPGSRLQGVMQLEDVEGGCAEFRGSVEIVGLLMVLMTQMFERMTTERK